MAVRDNPSPLGFGLILLFHSCLLGAALFLESFFEAYGGTFFWVLAGVAGAGLAVFGVLNRGFLWDVFRGFRSAATLLSLLVLSCVLATLIIQDLDLRRADVFDPGFEDADGKLPSFDTNCQSVRFAAAQAHFLLWLWPNEERSRLLAENVKLSPVEESQVAHRRAIFGDRAADTYRAAVLGSKRRDVEQLTTNNYAERHQRGFYTFWVVCRRLHLFDIFESWWFRLLLFLIAINLTVGTLARAPWQRRDWGIAATHAGILIILTGGLLDVVAAKGGTLRFRIERNNPAARVKAEVIDRQNRAILHLPFRVRLDRFATEHHHELLVESYDWTRRHDGAAWGDAEEGSRPFTVSDTFPVREGVPREFRDGSVKVTVHAYEPRVFVRTLVEDAPEGPLQPAVKLGLYAGAQGDRNFFAQGNNEPWLFANDPDGAGLEAYGSRFEFVWAADAEQYRTLLATPVKNVFRVVGAEGLAPMLVQTDPDGRAAASPLTGRVALHGLPNGFLALEASVLRARASRRVEPVSDAMFLARGGGDDEPLAAWADVTVESPWGTERRELTPYDRPLAVGPPGERPLFLFGLVNTGKPRDRFSVLTILDHDGRERKTHAVRTDSPLVHDGFRFFQTAEATDEDGVGVSVISVTSSPGVPFKVAGYAVLTLGVGAIFFLRRRRQEDPA